MDIQKIKQTAFTGLIWQLANKMGTNGMQILTYIILARLLQPEDFGIIAIVVVFINFSNILVNSGFGTALVQSKNVDDIDYSSVLNMSIIIAFIFYLIIFFTAPFIAAYYNQDSIVGVLRIYSISIIFFAINGVQTSILLRNLEFKKISIVSSIPVLISGIVSILMALAGFGVYALVANALISGILSVIFFGFILKWFPKPLLSITRIKKLFSYSSKLLLSSIIEEAYKGLYPLIIGKVFNTKVLGYYNYGRQIPNLISSTVNASVTAISFPLYSRSQDDIPKLKKMVRHSISLINFILFPLMAGLAAVAEPLVTLVFTEKWLPSVPYLQLFCVISGLYHIQVYNFHAISALGKSSVFLKYEIIKKSLAIAILLITLPFGIKVLVIGQVIFAVISIVINFKPNIRWLNYSIKEQLNDIWPYFVASIIMFICIRLVSIIEMPIVIKLIFEIILGISIYTLIAFIAKFNGFTILINIIKKRF